MSNYTEIYINFKTIIGTPIDVLNVLNYLFGDSPLPEKQDHPLFYSQRWSQIGICDVVGSSSFYDEKNKRIFITNHSSLKNYDKEIEKFLHWVYPYVDAEEGDIIGFIKDEYCNNPVMFVYKKDIPIDESILSNKSKLRKKTCLEEGQEMNRAAKNEKL